MSESVPAGWGETAVDDVVQHFQNGYAFSAKGYEKNGIPIVSILNIDVEGKFQFIPERVNYWKASSISELQRYVVNDNDLIIVMTDVTPSMNLLGRSAIVKHHQPLLLNQRVGLIRPNPKKICRYFLSYYFNHHKWRGYCIGCAGLAVQANLSTVNILNGEILLPPLPEQQKIASILTSVDTVIEKTEAQINKLKDLKKAMMQELLTKGIGHTEFKNSPVGRIPKGWEVVTLKNCISDISSGWSPVCEPTARQGNEWAVLKTTAIVRSGYAPYENKILPQKCTPRENAVVRKNDVLITRKGPRERVGVSVFVGESPVNLMIPDTVFRIGIRKGIEPSFISLAIGSKRVQKEWNERKVGLAESQVNINHPIINTTLIPLPPLSEQQNFTSILASVDFGIKEKQGKLSHTNLLKKALMQDLLTGKVRVKV